MDDWPPRLMIEDPPKRAGRWRWLDWLVMGCLLIILAGLVAVIIVNPASARERCHAEGVTDRYDRMFQRATKRHLPPGSDWCLVKAWAMAESNLKPGAVSPVGATGILQIMPGTGKFIEKRYGGKLRDVIGGGLKNARTNIEYAAAYIAHLRRVWSYPRSEWCRWKNVMASYNAGPGNIIKAQKASGGRTCWKHISAHLHKVTGKHAEETVSYVNTIIDNYLRLKGLVQ